MITLITASPGGGKTISAVWRYIKPACESGRQVFVNGVPGLTLPAVELSDEEVMRWHEVVPDGALIVLDEVQRVWRPMASGAAVPPSIAQLETHRHRGIDFVIITQHPGLLHRNVRLLVGKHLHIRVTALGRHVFEWPEYTESPQNKSARSNAVRSRMRLPKAAYGMYKSASIHVKQSHKVPPHLYLLIAALLALGGTAAYLVPSIQAKIHAKQGATSSDTAASAASGITASSVKVPRPTEPASPELRNLQAVSSSVDWSLVAACISMGDRCQCYGDAGQRLVIEPQTCAIAAQSGWGERGEKIPQARPIGPEESAAYMQQPPV